MGAATEGAPVVRMPGRLDRTLRLGPFPSGRSAVQFLAYAGFGAACAAVGAPLLGLPTLLAGGVLTLYRPGGEPLAAAARRWVGFRFRQRGRERHVNRPPSRWARTTRQVRLPDGRRAAIARTGGVPLAFLPPAELARRFEQYRELLDAVDAEVRIMSAASPLHLATLRPAGTEPSGPDRPARHGYDELVRLLGRRRSVRQVYVALVSPTGRPEASAWLDVQADSLLERLSSLGIRAERLTGGPLWASAARMGLGGGASS